MYRRRRRAERALAPIVALLLAASVIVACSGDDDGGGGGGLGDDPLATVTQSMAEAGSGRIEGTVDAPEGVEPGTVEGEWEGSLEEGSMEVRAEFPRRGESLPVTLRVVDGTFYFERAPVALPRNDSLFVFSRDESFKPWRAASLGAVLDGVPSAFSPLALLEWIERNNVELEAKGTEQIGDVDATRLTTTREILVGVWTGSTVDLWVDGEQRVVRVRVAGDGGGTQYDVTDFGAEVEIEAPAEDEVSTETEQPVVEPSGPFEEVASGTTEGVTWTLLRAPGTEGTSCWRWQATPPLPQVGLPNPDAFRCVKAPDMPEEVSDVSDEILFPVIGNGQGSYDALVALVPEDTAAATMGFVGGTTQDVPVSKPFVWIGPPQPLKGYLGLTLDDGTRVDCGAGAITTPDDLTNDAFTGFATTAAWACLLAE
jgi:hypothetical protein